MGAHYAETLRRWDEAFPAASEEVLALGFDETFLRMWHFYLEYSRAGFASGYIDVNQIVLARRGGPRMSDTATHDPTTYHRAGSDAAAGPRPPRGGVASALAEAVRPFVGGDLPVRLRAWDGSEAGPADAPPVELRSPDAVRRLLWHPGELGAAQAYVTGELDVPEDDGWTLDRRSPTRSRWPRSAGCRAHGPRRGRWRPRCARCSACRSCARPCSGGHRRRRPPRPGCAGRLHSPLRDRRAISHHYDLSNEFYSLILEDSMAYSCGYYDRRGRHARGGAARQARPGLPQARPRAGACTLLDVGCGWGSLSLHAAEHFGARVIGVTIAAEQKRFIDARIAERGLGDRVEIRLQDYREVPERDHFDAVASLEMGEHVGEGNYPTYAEVLRRSVRPGGRVLVQQMSRRTGKWPGGGPFIESFIAPDMYMRPVGETVAYLERGGLEVRDVHALREHYVRTVDGWLARFEANRDRLTELVGEEVVRVWRLYLVGGSMAFRDGRMGVDQILMVRPGAPHTLPSERDF